ncbi:MaoC family dehydratase [Ancylobacter sp. 6x-1]|uniref:MaoC family dehydratase n=1 Tax=Ancylobacter crimeensis TaxID=2579147 RepID=A0ABT0D9P6_9HYPH|nr:MaoC family dehydratase [Ancylobacter crimeensis]MCK0196668.1 MaoC family dehydratase [Ancylobacter crimeensis]
MRFFEDVDVGDEEALGSHTFMAPEIIAFARAWDPQPFHLDAAAAARTHFGGLVASGWHTAAIWSRLHAAAQARLHGQMRARGERVPRVGPSPGFRDLQWLKPVHAGDTLSFASKVTAKKPSASRPEWGLVFSHETGTNQYGRLVFAFTNCVFVERQEA